MNNYRHLIALDLDGTLLQNDRTISGRTRIGIEQVKNKCHIVMIATGRPYRASEMYYRELHLDTPIVNFNGAYVHHPKDKNWGVYHKPLPLSTVKEIVDITNKYSVNNIIAEVLDRIYLHYHDEKLIDIFKLGNPVVTSGDLRKFLKNDPTSLMIHSDEQNIGKINDYLAETQAEVIEHRSWGAPFPVIEIVKHGINKAIGVKKVADYYGIPRERIVAFGDEDNDLEMLEYAGYGVAMGNAIDEAKNAARDVTLTNEEDGVAEYLENMFL